MFLKSIFKHEKIINISTIIVNIYIVKIIICINKQENMSRVLKKYLNINGSF